MRAAIKMMALGALALGIMAPGAASASSPSVIHLFFDGKQQISSDTGFINTNTVSYGNSASHGPVVGKSMLQCVFLTDSTARCSASIVIYKPGTTTIDKSVFLKDEWINFNAPSFVVQGGTGVWTGAHGVVLVLA